MLATFRTLVLLPLSGARDIVIKVFLPLHRYHLKRQKEQRTEREIGKKQVDTGAALGCVSYPLPAFPVSIVFSMQGAGRRKWDDLGGLLERGIQE